MNQAGDRTRTLQSAFGPPMTQVGERWPGTAPGTATVRVLEDGQRIQLHNHVPVAGTVAETAGSWSAGSFRYETALSAGGVSGTRALVLDHAGQLFGYDDDNGVGRAWRLGGLSDVRLIGPPGRRCQAARRERYTTMN